MSVEGNVIDSRRTEVERLAAARAGDHDAFDALTRPLYRQLHVHCYRMLGTLDDADDALQETFLRAWRQLDRFEPRAPFRSWLYRIATNVCLTMLDRRGRRREVVPAEQEPGGGGDHDRRDGHVLLEPYPDHLLDELALTTPGPEAAVEHRERIELAFVAAVQALSPRQRAILLLRDVIGYSAAEVAVMLATSVAGVNSALQRARATLAQYRRDAAVTRPHAPADNATERALVQGLIDAWHGADVAGIVALLTEDAILSMPPLPDRFVGRAAIATFLATVPEGGRLDRFRLVPARANRQPAVALYLRAGESYQAHAVMVLATAGDEIASLVRFAHPGLFDHFRLPRTLAG